MNDSVVSVTSILYDAFSSSKFSETGPHWPTWDPLTGGALLVLLACTWTYLASSKGVSAPYAGHRRLWEPDFFFRMRFITGAPAMIQEGYSKWKDSVYKLARADGDVVVLSRKYVDDLRNISPERLSLIDGLIKNFGGSYSSLHIFRESDIATRAIKTKITPNLTKISGELRDEIDYSLRTDFPDYEDWTSVAVQGMFVTIVGRIINRVFIGMPLCRDKEWVEAGRVNSYNVTVRQGIFRFIPPIIRPLADVILPFGRKINSSRRVGVKILVPEIERRRELEATDPSYEKPSDLLQAVMDIANPGEKESEPENLARRILGIASVSILATAIAGTHALFDLVARPQYIEEMRAEALQVLEDDGGTWGKQSLSKLLKLDSFIRESQRMNPPSLLGFHRIVRDPAGITLHDGLYLPAGTHICVSPDAISNDPDIVPSPEVFDGLRSYKKRQEPGESLKHRHATTDMTHLHFGYGRWSCPGRFLASDEIKMIIVELLMRYEFKLNDGEESRPVNGNLGDLVYMNSETALLMRRRGVS